MSSSLRRLFKYIVFIITALAAIANFSFLTAYNLHPDEAYLWVWSRHLGPCYFDNSPMGAYVIRFFTFFGRSEFWVRLPAFLGWLSFLFFAYLMTQKDL